MAAFADTLKSSPIPWLGAVSTVATLALTTAFTWALGIQEKYMAIEARLRVVETIHAEIKIDLKEIKDNILFMRIQSNGVQPPVTIIKERK